MPWVEIFAVFLVSHLAGDFILQTDWQARNKRGGLGSDPTARRALLSHISTYTLAFVPAFVWLAGEIGAATLGVAALVALPHTVQDDGRLLAAYVHGTKGSSLDEGDFVFVAVDQSFHVLTLFLVSLVASG